MGIQTNIITFPNESLEHIKPFPNLSMMDACKHLRIMKSELSQNHGIWLVTNSVTGNVNDPTVHRNMNMCVPVFMSETLPENVYDLQPTKTASDS